MKETILSILAVLLFLSSFYFPFRLAYHDNQPKKVTVGPNQTYTWSSGTTFWRSLEGNFSLKSGSYFEVKHDQAIVQATYEKPIFGENAGTYWIHDLPMTGTWTISSSASIFSPEETTITISATFWYQVGNYTLAFFFCLMCLLISLMIIMWLDRVLS